MGFFKKNNKISSITTTTTDNYTTATTTDNYTTDNENETTPNNVNTSNLVIKPFFQEKTEENTEEKEWIWVEGYKGTDKDMKCHDFQYEIGKEFKEEKPIILCEKGFHLCLKLRDVFTYYDICNNNRFFKVKALVEKTEVEKQTTGNSLCWGGVFFKPDKLVAKSIIFIEELSIDEIFKEARADYLPLEYKQKALEIGITEAAKSYHKVLLEDCGYNEELADYFLTSDKYPIAYALGKQKELTMYEKISLALK